MPKRTDIHKILIVGSGPIVIGQACEFDYSGTQACKALREEGFEVVLVNSNPATIMTDPNMADQTYIEPITPEIVEKIIAAERPDALLPTMGGQTGLNTAMELAKTACFTRYNVQLIGADYDAIKTRREPERIQESHAAHRPRPSQKRICLQYGRGLADCQGHRVPAYHPAELHARRHGRRHCIRRGRFRTSRRARACTAQRINEILIEESVIGWKEYELEIMRDRKPTTW